MKPLVVLVPKSGNDQIDKAVQDAVDGITKTINDHGEELYRQYISAPMPKDPINWFEGFEWTKK